MITIKPLALAVTVALSACNCTATPNTLPAPVAAPTAPAAPSMCADPPDLSDIPHAPDPVRCIFEDSGLGCCLYAVEGCTYTLCRSSCDAPWQGVDMDCGEKPAPERGSVAPPPSGRSGKMGI